MPCVNSTRRRWEFTLSRHGKVAGKCVRVVAPDGTTVTTTNYGPNASEEPLVAVLITFRKFRHDSTSYPMEIVKGSSSYPKAASMS